STSGGIRVNLIPREGGNTFRGSSYFAAASSGMQGNNLTSDLVSRGLLVRDSIQKNYDVNPGVGGPIFKDKLWFYASFRTTTANNYVGGLFVDRNAGNPNAFAFNPDLGRQAVRNQNWRDTQVRLTWQVSRKGKLGVTVEELKECRCQSGPSATVAIQASAA